MFSRLLVASKMHLLLWLYPNPIEGAHSEPPLHLARGEGARSKNPFPTLKTAPQEQCPWVPWTIKIAAKGSTSKKSLKNTATVGQSVNQQERLLMTYDEI